MCPAPLPSTPESGRPSRRAIARGAAWSVPIIAVGAAAPAMAASGCPSLPAFSTTDWTLVQSGSAALGGARFDAGTFVVDGDADFGSTYSATASRTLAVVEGLFYTFTYSYTAVTHNWNAMTSVLQIDGSTVADSTIDTTTSGTSGSVSATYVAPATGNVTVAVRMSTSDAVFEPGDDITVGAITVGCSVPG